MPARADIHWANLPSGAGTCQASGSWGNTPLLTAWIWRRKNEGVRDLRMSARAQWRWDGRTADKWSGDGREAWGATRWRLERAGNVVSTWSLGAGIPERGPKVSF